MVQPNVIELLWLFLISSETRFKLVSVTGYLALLTVGGFMMNGSMIALALKSSTLEAQCRVWLRLVAIVEADSTPSRGALVATTVASHMLLFEAFHVEAIFPGVVGWTTGFTMLGTWSLYSLLIGSWAAELAWLLEVATLFLLLKT